MTIDARAEATVLLPKREERRKGRMSGGVDHRRASRSYGVAAKERKGMRKGKGKEGSKGKEEGKDKWRR